MLVTCHYVRTWRARWRSCGCRTSWRPLNISLSLSIYIYIYIYIYREIYIYIYIYIYTYIYIYISIYLSIYLSLCIYIYIYTYIHIYIYIVQVSQESAFALGAMTERGYRIASEAGRNPDRIPRRCKSWAQFTNLFTPPIFDVVWTTDLPHGPWRIAR